MKARVIGMCGLVVCLLCLGGCPSLEMAGQGVPQRGPVELKLAKDANGNLTSLEGKVAGGTASVVHYERTSSVAPDGTKSEHVLATSDPTLVQQTHYEAVANQSKIDAANIQSTISLLTAELRGLAGEIVRLRGDLAAQTPAASGPARSRSDELRELLGMLKELGVIKTP